MTSAQRPVAAVLPPGWTLADRLRKIRREILDVDQAEFARLLGVTRPAYGTYEAGRHEPRDVVAFAKRIELLTGVPATWTLGLDDAQATAEAPPAAASVTAGKGTTKGSCSTTAGSDVVRQLAEWPATNGSDTSAEWLRAS